MSRFLYSTIDIKNVLKQTATKENCQPQQVKSRVSFSSKPHFIRTSRNVIHWSDGKQAAVGAEVKRVAARPSKVSDSRLQLSEIPSLKKSPTIIQSNGDLDYSRSPVTKISKKISNDEYTFEIGRNLKNTQHTNSECLSRHHIISAYRAKMVDWMIEVLKSFKCSDQTFFLAVNIMDRYFAEKKNECLQASKLHLIGMTCMFIASKLEDVYPILMNTIYNKVGHQKFAKEKIAEQEQDILKTLKFRVLIPTQLEFLDNHLEKMPLDKSIKGDTLLKKISLYLSKMSLHDYEMCAVKPSLQAVSGIYVALNVCEQINKKTLVEKDTLINLASESGHTETEIIDCAQKVLFNLQNFENLYPGLEKLKQAHYEELSAYL